MCDPLCPLICCWLTGTCVPFSPSSPFLCALCAALWLLLIESGLISVLLCSCVVVLPWSLYNCYLGLVQIRTSLITWFGLWFFVACIVDSISQTCVARIVGSISQTYVACIVDSFFFVLALFSL
jgi:hypothetical protein